MKLAKYQLRKIIRAELLREKLRRRVDGWEAATPENMWLKDDDSQQWGGWPEGEYDPPVTKQLRDYYKDMGMMEGDQE